MSRALRPASRQRMQWNDLQYVLAVADTGSLAGAASALRVNRTTVLRRINCFERTHGVRLFERLQSGYQLTPAGNELLTAARGLEDTIVTLERKLAGQDSRAEGLVRLTTSDTLLGSVLAAPLLQFQEKNPRITLEITTVNALLNLSRRDADVAIRPVTDPPEDLIGRRICDIAFAVYASTGYGERKDLKAPLGDHRWIAPDETLAGTSVVRWMRNSIPDVHPVIRVDSLVAMREVCAAGSGLAALPCYLGDLDERLVRVRPPVREMTTALWVLSHPDLVRTARVRLFVDFMVASLRTARSVFEGERRR